MKRFFRPRLIALIAATTALATLIPAGFAVGFHDDGDTVDFGSGVLQLHMVDGDSDEFRYGDITQPITNTRCEVSVADANPADDLITFQGTSDRGPGIFDHGLGVKSGGAQGVACSRVSDTEELHVSLLQGEDLPLDGLMVAEAHLDIEVKQSAEVVITTYFGGSPLETFALRSGNSIIEGEGSEPHDQAKAIVISTSDDPTTLINESITNCRNRSDSGPDAGAADNCRWVLKDITPFDSFVMTAGAGEFTLEGGNDGTAPAIDGYGSDSLFFLAAGIDCGETVSTGDGFEDPEGVFTRLQNVDGSPCVPKPYSLSSSFSSGDNLVDFFPEGAQDAQYSARLTSLPYTASQTLPTIEYDPDGEGPLGYRLMQWCLTAEITYVADDDGDLVQDLETGLIERLIGPAGDAPILPAVLGSEPPENETWCIADMETRVLDDPAFAGMIQTTWWAYGQDDPGFRFG